MAIFITGDTHGNFTRFKKDIFYEQSELTKGDYVIICGDFGGVWDELSGGLYQRDALTDFFGELRQRHQLKYWFFGHYHENVIIQKRFVLLYEQIIKLCGNI